MGNERSSMDGNDKARIDAETYRAIAKMHAANGDFSEMVDNIINAAILEVAIIQSDALKHIPMSDSAVAWAAVHKKTGKVLRDLRGHYAIYTHQMDAAKDCPKYGSVRQVRIRPVSNRRP